MAQPKAIVIDDLTGGRNGQDDPFALPSYQCVEAMNVDHYQGRLARKRGGAVAIAESGGTAFSVGIQTLLRHVPGADETLAELWGVDGAATPIVKRLTNGTAWGNVTLDDAIASRPADVVGASLNGKLFLAYDSSVDRLHVYDPGLTSPRVRRVGIAASAAPVVTNTAAGGAYAATPAYWRVRWVQITGALVIRRSEPSPSVAFTPSGVNVGVTVTQPTPPGEGENAWEIEVSLDNATWTVVYGSVATPALPIGTTSAAITATVAAIVAVGQISDPIGMYALFPSVKHLITDGNRLLGFGAWEATGAISGGKQSRFWYTPVLGSADKGDDERVPNMTAQKNWGDCNENDGGGFTGAGAVNGVPYAFKYRQIWRLQPTGDVLTPYLPKKISDAYGAINHKSIVQARDHVGNPAIYFLSSDGPCRVVVQDGYAVTQYLGRDVLDLWATVNKAATGVVGHGIYHADKQQVWWWIATGASNDPDVKLTFDVMRGKFTDGDRIRGGWYRNDGPSSAARCAAMFSNTLAAAMSRDLKPYLGRATGTVVWKADTADLDDAGTTFKAYVTTRPILTTSDLLTKVGIAESTLVGKAQGDTTITVTINRDFGKETRAHSVLLTASAAGETRVVKKVEGSGMGEADVIQMTVGDASALASTWTLDCLIVPLTTQEVR